MTSEIKIRDFLATNLQMLEHGLIHIETEHRLPNPFGGKGSIDILARDSAGHRVIIEVKRSDTSAREAIHELCKYIALIKSTHGLPQHRLRCFVVSTHWHELLVPFAEFVRTSDFQVEGFRLRVAPDGTPLSAERVELPSAPTMVDLFFHHDILLYTNSEHRDTTAAVLAEQLLQGGAESAFVCRLDHSGRPFRIPYPHALYAVVGGLDPVIRKTLEEQLLREYSSQDLDSIRPILVQQTFSTHAIKALMKECDSYEIGYPDKLTAMLRGDWRCLEILRRGRMTSTAAITDSELLDAIQGMSGTNTTIYHRLATPRVSGSWADFRRSADMCLRGNPSWENEFGLFCDFVEREYPDTLVAAKIYNPLALPLSIYKLIAKGNPSYWPVMEIVSNESAADSTMLISHLAWNGRKCVDSVAELFDGIVGDPFDYFMLQTRGEAWTVDEELRRRLGLEYRSFVTKPMAGNMYRRYTLAGSSDHVSLVPTSVSEEPWLEQYMATNGKLISELCSVVDYLTYGL